MGPTEKLRYDHDLISMLLSVLEDLCGLMEVWRPVNQKDFEEVLSLCRRFVAGPHMGKEEEVLFPLLQREKRMSLVKRFSADHTKILDSLDKIDKFYKKTDFSSVPQRTVFLRAVNRFIDQKLQHMNQEDRILLLEIDRLPTSWDQRRSLRTMTETGEDHPLNQATEQSGQAIRRLASKYIGRLT